MQTFIYPLLLILMGFCAFLFAQEGEGVWAYECGLYPPNTLITCTEYNSPLFSMKTDQENWTTDIFLRGMDDSGGYRSYSSSLDICLRVAASGNQIKISGFQNSTCGISTPFHTHEWYVNDDEVFHLLIQGLYSSSLSLRLLGYDTQVASIPIDVSPFMTLNSSTGVEFHCHKGCPLYDGDNEDIEVTNKPIVIYGLESPLNLTMTLMTSHDGIKESRNIELPFPPRNNKLYQVEVKEAENGVMITINGERMLYQVAQEKMFSLEETILKIRSDGGFLYTDPDCTFKDQENEDNKDGDGDDGITADEGDGDDGIAAATTAADDGDGDDTTSADDGDDKEKPRQNHKIIIDMSLKMNVTLTLV